MACDPKVTLSLPRRYRLSRREGFSPILREKALIKAWFAVHSSPNSTGHARLGITVSKRIVPAATRRNAAKRMIRECFRMHCRPGAALDLVIRLRKPVEAKDVAVARSTLGSLLDAMLAAR